jgi:hypothetical protein
MSKNFNLVKKNNVQFDGEIWKKMNYFSSSSVMDVIFIALTSF